MTEQKNLSKPVVAISDKAIRIDNVDELTEAQTKDALSSLNKHLWSLGDRKAKMRSRMKEVWTPARCQEQSRLMKGLFRPEVKS